MNTTNAAVGAGAIVVLGRWSDPGGPGVIDVRLVVGVVFLAIFLSIIPDNLAKPVSWLILTVLAFRYFPSIVGATGISNTVATTQAKRGGNGSVNA